MQHVFSCFFTGAPSWAVSTTFDRSSRSKRKSHRPPVSRVGRPVAYATSKSLEVELQSKLDLPRCYDRSLRERGLPSSIIGFIYVAEQTRWYLADVEVIDAVETLDKELCVQPLRDLRGLGDGDISAERARTRNT